jgi:IS30 family transposase
MKIIASGLNHAASTTSREINRNKDSERVISTLIQESKYVTESLAPATFSHFSLVVIFALG